VVPSNLASVELARATRRRQLIKRAPLSSSASSLRRERERERELPDQLADTVEIDIESDTCVSHAARSRQHDTVL